MLQYISVATNINTYGGNIRHRKQQGNQPCTARYGSEISISLLLNNGYTDRFDRCDCDSQPYVCSAFSQFVAR